MGFTLQNINDKEELTNILKTMTSKIIFNNDDILIVKINNYQDIKVLGSDTSWCIVPSESTYNSYTKNGFQYILYNYKLAEYDVKFKIGFTLYKGEIYTAHDVLDSQCIPYLRGILTENNVDVKSLIPETKSEENKTYNLTIDDINKINGKFTELKLKGMVNQCSSNLLPDLIRKLMEVKKSDSIKGPLIRKCFKIIFETKQYILYSEINKMFPPVNGNDIYWYINGYDSWRSKIILENKFSSSLSETAFLKALEIWPDIVYKRMDGLDLNYLDEEYSKQTIKLFADKLNSIYIENRLSFKLDNNEPDWRKADGVKYSKLYEATMLLANYYSGNVKSTPDYDKITKSSNSLIPRKIKMELKVPIDLLDYNYRNKLKKEEIPLIIKKDYDDYISLFSSKFWSKYGTDSITEEMGIINDLVNHLDGYKLSIKIPKQLVKIFLSNKNNYQDDSKAIQLLEKFKNPLRSGTKFTDGKLSIGIF